MDLNPKTARRWMRIGLLNTLLSKRRKTFASLALLDVVEYQWRRRTQKQSQLYRYYLCYSLRVWANKIGCSSRTTSKAFQALAEDGLLTVVFRPFTKGKARDVWVRPSQQLAEWAFQWADLRGLETNGYDIALRLIEACEPLGQRDVRLQEQLLIKAGKLFRPRKRRKPPHTDSKSQPVVLH